MNQTPSVRCVSSGDPEFPALLNYALRLPQVEVRRPMGEVAELLAAARQGELQLGPAIVHEVGGFPKVAVVGIQSAGAASLFLLSPSSSGTESTEGRHCLELASRFARENGCKLLEVLLDPGKPDELNWHGPLRETGFKFLTRLVYLSRRISGARSVLADSSRESWISYSSDTEPLFLRCMEESYVNTLDCPELNGVRTTAEVLAGHRAAGGFDPGLWKLMLRDQQAVGVLLLNRLRGGTTTEITYLGVAQTSRRTGVASALVRMAESLSVQECDTQLALAVDIRNVPARQLYARCGFAEVQFRDVWIAACAQVTMGSDVGNT